MQKLTERTHALCRRLRRRGLTPFALRLQNHFDETPQPSRHNSHCFASREHEEFISTCEDDDIDNKYIGNVTAAERRMKGPPSSRDFYQPGTLPFRNECDNT